MNKPKTFKVPTVAVVIQSKIDTTQAEFYNLNEYEFTNLRLEYAKGMWKDYYILTWFKDEKGNPVSGYLEHNGACHPMLPPQFAVIDKMHLDIFSLKFGKEPAHWKEAIEKDEELRKRRRETEEKNERDYQEYLKSL